MFADAVVDPAAVVVEMVDASITYFAMSGGVPDVAAAGVAIKTVLQLLKDVFLVAVAVSQHHSVSQVHQRSVEATDQ